MTTTNALDTEKVNNNTIKYGMQDLTIGINSLLLAYEKPIEKREDGSIYYRIIREDTLRCTLPDRITYQIEPIERCLNPKYPPAKKAYDFLESRIKAGWTALPDTFAKEQNGEKGAYAKALRNLKRCTTALHNYFGRYVILD